MAGSETIGDQHRWAIEAIAGAGLLSGPDEATYHGHVAFLSAEGSSNLAGLRSYSSLTVPSELRAYAYAAALRRIIHGQEQTPRDYELGVLDERVLEWRQAGLGRCLDRQARQYAVAAEVLDAEHLREMGLGWAAVRDQIWSMQGLVDSRDPIDIRVVPIGIAGQVLESNTAFTILRNADGIERVFTEQEGLMQPAPVGLDETCQEAWQTLYDQALDPEASAAFIGEQLRRY